MPDKTRASCQECGRHRNEVGPISWGGYCGDCGPKLLLENMDGLHTQSGIAVQRWKFGYARRLFGPAIANALFSAGAFDTPVDETAQGS